MAGFSWLFLRFRNAQNTSLQTKMEYMICCGGKGRRHPYPMHLPENWPKDVQVLAVFSRWGSREVWKLAKLTSPTAKEA